jgi:hypothetical protein
VQQGERFKGGFDANYNILVFIRSLIFHARKRRVTSSKVYKKTVA